MNDTTYLNGLRGDGSEKAVSAFWKGLRKHETATQIRVIGRIVPKLPSNGNGQEEKQKLFQFAFSQLAKTGDPGFIEPFGCDRFAAQAGDQLRWSNVEDVLEGFVVIRHLELESTYAHAIWQAAVRLLEDGYVREDNIRLFQERGIDLVALTSTDDE